RLEVPPRRALRYLELLGHLGGGHLTARLQHQQDGHQPVCAHARMIAAKTGHGMTGFENRSTRVGLPGALLGHRLAVTIDRPAASRLPLSYVLPIRRSPGAGAPDPELSAYLRTVASTTELIVVDGSSERAFAAAHEEWKDICRHVPPRPNVSARNGKVRGVITGLHLASHEALVIADDDVRY